jgi:ribonucleoside-diphosphate reductase alpha chain
MKIMTWDEQRRDVFLDRYAARRADGTLAEDEPSAMWARVSSAVGCNPYQGLRFFEALADWRFVPSGRILSGAGLEGQNTMYNCFVLGVEPGDQDPPGRDSRRSIMDTLGRMVEITARGGGVGINWSVLRPEGAEIRGVRGKSSGAVNWMRGADGLADQIRQGGSRTAALMFMLDIWHPDVLSLVREGTNFKRANFSVAVSDAFMDALQRGADWTLRFPDTSDPDYDTEWDGDIIRWAARGHRVKEYGTVAAADLWGRLCMSAWATGNPGVVYMDRCNQLSNTGDFEQLIGTNPCAEQPLPANGCCNLGSINLLAMWDEDKRAMDWPQLRQTVRTAVEFMDRVIDVSVDVNWPIGSLQRRVRRIGIGTMGLADVLLMEGIRYGSGESLDYIHRLYGFIRDAAYEASADLAAALGPAPAYTNRYLERPFIRNLPSRIREKIQKAGIRNLAILTQAPTGTTSILAGASSGIEPIFSRTYTRKDATGTHEVRHPLLWGGEEDYQVVAHEVPPDEHVYVQAVVQQYVDSSISKTINLPPCAGLEDVDRAFRLAYETGCKGVTVYRDGSRGEGVLNTSCPTCQV